MNRTIRVLVADDETNLRELIVRELTRRGLEAQGVGDGESALERLREGPYDVVVLDMKMPKKEGIEVAYVDLRFDDQGVLIKPANCDPDHWVEVASKYPEPERGRGPV